MSICSGSLSDDSAVLILCLVCRHTRSLNKNISTVTIVTDADDPHEQSELEWCWNSNDSPPVDSYVNVTFAVPVVLSRIENGADSAVMRYSVFYSNSNNDKSVFYGVSNNSLLHQIAANVLSAVDHR